MLNFLLRTSLLILIIAAGSCPSVINAQEHEKVAILQPSYISFGVKEGLPSSFVSHLFNDSRGLLWISTAHGVCNFDGRSIEVIPSGGLMDDFVLCVTEDPKGKIWCQTIEGRIYRLDDQNWTGHPLNDTLALIAQRSAANGTMAIDSTGRIFLSGNPNILCISENGLSLEPVADMHHSNRFEIFGNQVFGNLKPRPPSDQGHTFYFQNKKLTYTFNHLNTFDRSIATKTFAVVGNDLIAVSLGKIIFSVSGGEQRVLLHESEVTNSLLYDLKGRLWAGTDFSGAYAYVDGQLRFRVFPHEKITAIAQDFEGGYWFAMGDNGLRYVPTLSSSIVQAPQLFKGDIQLYTYADDLYILDSRGTVFKNNKEYSRVDVPDAHMVFPGCYREDNIIVSSVLVDKHNRYLQELNLDKDSKRLTTSKVCPRLMVKLGEDTAFFSYSRLTIGGRNDSHLAIAFHRIKDILRLAGDTFLLASDKGIHELVMQDRSKGKSGILNTHLDSIRFTHLAHVGDRVLCFPVGSPPYTFNLRSHTMSSCNEMPVILPRKLLKLNRDTLLIGTEQGLFLLASASNEHFSLINITAKTGLANTRINDLVLMHDSLFMAGPEEIQVLDLRALRNATQPPARISIRAAFVNTKEVESAFENMIVNTTDHVSFQVTAVSFKLRKNLRYAYRLLPLDTHWVVTANTEIDFFNLPAGSYELQLRNNKDVVSTPFEVTQFFYEETWFHIIVIVLLTALLLLPIYTLQRMRHTELRMKREKDQLQLQNLTNQLKPHFVFNALSSIQAFILENDTLKSSEYLSQFAQHIRHALSFASKENITLEQAIGTIKNYLELERMRLNNGFDFEITVNPAIAMHQVMIPVMLLQPYVENAVIHGMANIDYGGNIHVSFELGRDKRIVCLIRDNGIGLDADNTDYAKTGNGLGTSINRQRIHLINALRKQHFEVDIASNTDGPGVSVTILIPTSNE